MNASPPLATDVFTAQRCLHARSKELPLSSSVAFVIAAALHLGIAGLAARLPARAPLPPPPVVTELDLAPVPPPPPPPPPQEEPKPDPAPVVAKAPIPNNAPPPPPAAARAGALLTAKEDPAKPAKPSDAPVDFVTDPNGQSFGGGVVARGGTADFGVTGAVAGGKGDKPAPATTAPPAPPGPRGDAIVPASDLSRGAKLEEADACRGFYPAGAEADSAVVTLTVVVRPGGDVQSVSVASESPAGQGFGGAARRCIQSKRFSPALDKEGKAVLSAAPLRVRFSR